MSDYINFRAHPRFHMGLSGAAFMALLATYSVWFLTGTIAFTHLPIILAATGLGALGGYLGVQFVQLTQSWVRSGKAFFQKLMNVLDQSEKGLKNINERVMPDVENQLKRVDDLVAKLNQELAKADGCIEGLDELIGACKATGDRVNGTIEMTREMTDKGFAAFGEMLGEAREIGDRVKVTLENVDRLIDTAGQTAEAVADATAPVGAPVRGLRWLFGYSGGERPESTSPEQRDIDAEMLRFSDNPDADTDCDEESFAEPSPPKTGRKNSK